MFKGCGPFVITMIIDKSGNPLKFVHYDGNVSFDSQLAELFLPLDVDHLLLVVVCNNKQPEGGALFPSGHHVQDASQLHYHVGTIIRAGSGFEWGKEVDWPDIEGRERSSAIRGRGFDCGQGGRLRPSYNPY